MLRPIYNLPNINSPRANIFSIMGDVCLLLKRLHLQNEAAELQTRIYTNNEAHSYEEAIQIINEYVEVIR